MTLRYPHEGPCVVAARDVALLHIVYMSIIDTGVLRS